MSNPAAVLHGINDLRYEDFPIAAHPGEGMVRVEMKAVGICGSDVSGPSKHLYLVCPAILWTQATSTCIYRAWQRLPYHLSPRKLAEAQS